MRFLHIIWANLRRKWLRTALTLMSILVAFLLFGYLSSVKHAFNMGVDLSGADRLIVRHRISIIQLLPLSYGARMAKIEGVKEVTHATWFGGVYIEFKNFFPQIPVEPEAYLSMYPEFLLSDEEREAWLSTRTGAVAGRNIADKYGWKVGDRIPIQATVWMQKENKKTWEFDLVGIYEGAEKGTDTTQFLFRYDYFDEARAFGEGLVGWYLVRVDDPAEAAAVAERIDNEFANSPKETKAETEKAFVQAFAKQMGNIGAMIIAIMSAVFFTILLVAGNTMAQAVRERTGELAVLKAVGFTNIQVLLLVIFESCLLAAIGGGLGLLIAWTLITVIGDPTGGALPIFFFPMKDLIAGIVIIILFGLAVGLFPALQAMRLKIADALRRT